MPLYLLSEVIQSIVVMSEYFDELSQYNWMHETLVEIYKSCEREDEVLWPHLIYGICFAGSKLSLVSPFIMRVHRTKFRISDLNELTKYCDL
jgi:hypothetical protein